MPASILYIGRTYTPEYLVLFRIDGREYEYSLTPQQCDTVEYLCRKVGNAKALAFAKRRAIDLARTSAPSIS